MKRNHIAWSLWAVGTTLVIFSWTDVVSTTIGWCGFALGLVGSVISWGLGPPPAERPAESPNTEKNDDDMA